MADNISLYPGKSDKEKLVDRLVNGLDIDEELSDEYDDDFGSSCDEQMEIEGNGVSSLVTANRKPMSKSILEMYLQCEIQAVMRIKQQFFKWFEEFFTKTTSIFLGQSASQ